MASGAAGIIAFDLKRFFPDSVFSAITEARVESPENHLREAGARKRRKKLTRDGKLHDPWRRIIRDGWLPARERTPSACATARRPRPGPQVVTNRRVDGVMERRVSSRTSSSLNHLVKQGGGPSFLDEKVILGSMNRAGLRARAFEMDDTFTSFSVESILLLRLDAAKTMFRLEVASRDSARTMLANANIISELNRHEIPASSRSFRVVRGLQGSEIACRDGQGDRCRSAMGDSSRISG